MRVHKVVLRGVQVNVAQDFQVGARASRMPKFASACVEIAQLPSRLRTASLGGCNRRINNGSHLATKRACCISGQPALRVSKVTWFQLEGKPIAVSLVFVKLTRRPDQHVPGRE